MPLLASGLTDIGKKRQTNQDAIVYNIQKNFFIVADGMGGHQGGDIASNMAIQIISEYLNHHWNLDPTILLHQSAIEANNQIKNYANTHSALREMGTTVVSFLFRGPFLYVLNVGDSRGYLFTNQKIFQLTKDHSIVQDRLSTGVYNRAAAAKDPQKNILFRAVGHDDDLSPDIFTYKVNRGDMFLLCSDGLHGKVSDEDILYIINQTIPDPFMAQQSSVDQAVLQLVNQANENGGNDNISVILVVAI